MNRPTQWIPPGQPTRVAGYVIPDGLIYVGHHLRSAIGAIEPSLINPALPLVQPAADPGGPDPHPVELAPAPSYHLIPPASRAAYLAWLAGGRRADVPIGYVSLFFAGLERRVLVDLADDAGVRQELPMIAAEVRRLRAAFGSTNTGFDAGAGAFLEVLDLLTAPVTAPGTAECPPPPRSVRWPVPIALRLGLARFAAGRTPVPAGWARSWVWYHPSLFPGTPQTRCPDEFDRLFEVRFGRGFPYGLAVSGQARPPVRIGYQPASPGIDSVVLDRPDLPDVLEEPSATRELGTLTDSVTDALTPYSRWLARVPGGAGTLASTALLPTDLLDVPGSPLRPVRSWADRRLAGGPSAIVDFAELRGFWSTTDPDRMSRDEVAAFAAALARTGLGVEPDARFGGPPLARGPVVLFRLDRDAPHAPASGYRTAATMLLLAAAVQRPTLTADSRSSTGAANPTIDDVVARILAELSIEIRRPVAERPRLGAWLRWLLAAGSAAPALERRIAALTAAEREATARFLIGVARSGGPSPDPATVSALTRAYRLLGLDAALVYHRLHEQSLDKAGVPSRTAGARPADGPVVVRRARPGPPGHDLPRRRAGAGSTARPPTVTTDVPAGSPAGNSGVAADSPAPARVEVRLDPESVARKVAETRAVSRLLAGIFDEGDGSAAAAASPDPQEPPREPVPPPAGPGDPVQPAPAKALSSAIPAQPVGCASEAACENGPVHLDPAYRALLREMVGRPSWSWTDFTQAAARHGVLPAGALDVLNEAAMQAVGEPVIEGDDELSLNDFAVREMRV